MQKKRTKISANQKRFLNFYLEGETKGNISLSAEKTGISRQAVYNWMRVDEVFKDFLKKHGEACSGLIEPHAWESLKRNVIAGDTPSLALYFKIRGMAKEHHKVENILSPAERDETIKTLTEALRSFLSREERSTQDIAPARCEQIDQVMQKDSAKSMYVGDVSSPEEENVYYSFGTTGG